MGKEEGRETIVQSVSNGVSEIQSIYPRLPIDREKTVQFGSEPDWGYSRVLRYFFGVSFQGDAWVCSRINLGSHPCPSLRSWGIF